MDPHSKADDATETAALIEELRGMLRDAPVEFQYSRVVAEWREKLRSDMVVAPRLKPELGAMLGEMMQVSKRWANRTAYCWVSVGGGRIAMGHRPRRKAIESMPAAGVTHVVTLLSEAEGAPSIGADVKRAGLVWIWLPLANAEPPAPSRLEDIKKGLATIKTALSGRGSIFLHCSAGIHRTGMITFALLRSLGANETESIELLKELRIVTREGVGAHRIAWGNQFGH